MYIYIYIYIYIYMQNQYGIRVVLSEYTRDCTLARLEPNSDRFAVGQVICMRICMRVHIVYTRACSITPPRMRHRVTSGISELGDAIDSRLMHTKLYKIARVQTSTKSRTTTPFPPIGLAGFIASVGIQLPMRVVLPHQTNNLFNP